ncbi:MAG: hypothetical protein PHY93_18525 [Bacteriovorax sp.]|nr:hypothetical protein [Bacteriovorax sp.]
MKIILVLGFFILVNANVFAFDFKGKLLEAAKDKKVQEQAKEIAQKGMEYIKGDKKDEVKTDVVPAPVTPPVVEKTIKKTKHKKIAKKSQNTSTEEMKIP